MRISDWSSDVCSSDLSAPGEYQVCGLSADQAAPVRMRSTRSGLPMKGRPKLIASATPLARSASAPATSSSLLRISGPRKAARIAGDRYGTSVRPQVPSDRKTVVKGKSGSERVDLGDRLRIKNKN